MKTKILRNASGALVRAEVDDDDNIFREIEVLERAGEGVTAIQQRGASAERTRGNEIDTLAERIGALLNDAANAPEYRTHSPGGFDHERAVAIPVSPARSALLNLSSERIAGLFNADGSLNRAPAAKPSEAELPLSTAILRNSKVARAGAGVVILPEPTAAKHVGKVGAIAFESVPRYVRNIEAATWSTVDVDSTDAVPVSDSPIAEAEINWDNSVMRAVRFEVNRKARKRYGDEFGLVNEIIAGLVLGLARSADELLLDALADATLQPFTLGRAAAQGVEVGDLRALVGTAGIGAAIGHDGNLRVTSMPALPVDATPDTAAMVAATLSGSGVPGELTPDTTGTFIAAWNRLAVCIRDDATIHVQRHGLQGQMTIIAQATMLPVLPSTDRAWTVPA